MILSILILAISCNALYGAAGTDLSLIKGPVKAGVPDEFVCAVFRNKLSDGFVTATQLNDDKEPTGQINEPYKQITKIGYSAYAKQNPEMIADSEPFIVSVNNDPVAGQAWRMVVAAKNKRMSVRKSALSIYWDAVNTPLTKEEMIFIPDLKGAPHMELIMLLNQKLELSREQKKVWNAIFATSASILGAMQKQDGEAFASLFRDEIPDPCPVQ